MKSLFSFLFFIVFAVTVSFAQSETTAVKGSGCSKGSEAKACCAKGSASTASATEAKSCCAKGSASSCKGDKASADVSNSGSVVVEEQAAPVKVVRKVTHKGAQPKKDQN